MPTWPELRADFQALEQNLQYFRLDYQWGAAGVYYNIAGGGFSPSSRRFEILAEIAGQLLTLVPAEHLDANVLAAPPGKSRWYEALRYHSGEFQHEGYGTQYDDAGKTMGNIYMGKIHLPVHASVNLALQLSAVEPHSVAPIENPNATSRLNAFLRQEASKRGYLWLVVGFLVTLIVGALAI